MNNIIQLSAQRDGEPRITDVELAEGLGYPDVRDFRRLIQRHSDALGRFGILGTVPINQDGHRGRPGRAYLLTEHQAVYITAKSEMPTAVDVTVSVVAAFVSYRRQARDEPKLLFRTFLLADEVRAWERAYPERFFVELHRVGGWKKPAGNNHSNCAHFINRYVYQHLLGDLGLHVIRECNPSNDEGVRAHKHHSMLKREHMPVLTRHIERVQDILINSVSLSHFDDGFNRTFPRPDTQTGMMFGERA